MLFLFWNNQYFDSILSFILYYTLHKISQALNAETGIIFLLFIFLFYLFAFYIFSHVSMSSQETLKEPWYFC